MAGEFSVGSIVSRLKLDKKGWDTAVKDVEKQQQTMASFAKKHSEAIKTMGRTMTIAGGIIVGSLGFMVKKASESQETFAKFGTVFKDVIGDANESAKNLAENFGFQIWQQRLYCLVLGIY